MRLGLALACLCLPGAAAASPAAEISFFSAADSGQASLAVPSGVRATGMGEAYTAVGDDASSLNWDPAGLARLPGFELGLAHNEWSTGLGFRQESLAYGQRLTPGSGFGLALNYFSLGSLVSRSADGASNGESSPFAAGASAGYGWSVFPDHSLKLGVASEFAMESLFTAVSTGFGATLGLDYDVNAKLSLGLALKHLGSGSGGFAPPSTADLGLAYRLFSRLLLAFDGSLPFHGDPALKTGLELDLGVLQLRGGYRYALSTREGDLQSGLSAGAGFQAGLVSIDYAYVPYGALLSSHRLSASLRLPADFFAPSNNGPELSTETAQAYYEKGIEFELARRPIEAMVQYQMVENSYPEALKAAPLKFYLTAQARLKSIQLEMEKKGGNSAEMKAYIQIHTKAASEHLGNGRFKEALTEVKLVEAFDKISTRTLQLRKQAEDGLLAQMSGLRAQARKADAEDDLEGAVAVYMKIQAAAPEDEEAAAFFSKRHPAIKALLVSIYRRGIDLYVQGNVEEAVKAWKRGKAIDIDHGQTVDFERDLQRAKYSLGQHGQK